MLHFSASLKILHAIISSISGLNIVKEFFYYPEQPRHPQWTHSTIFPSSNLVLGTRQMQLVAKFVSLV